jgi:hypothetical protein
MSSDTTAGNEQSGWFENFGWKEVTVLDSLHRMYLFTGKLSGKKTNQGIDRTKKTSINSDVARLHRRILFSLSIIHPYIAFMLLLMPSI